MQTRGGSRRVRRDLRRGTMGRLPGASIAASALALLGLAVMLYPGTASWWSQFEQSRVIRQLGETVADEPGSELRHELQRARAYNESLTSGAKVAAGSNAPLPAGDPGTPDDGYDSLLRGDAAGAIGRLRIPGIELDLPIYHGTSDGILQKGIGHLRGTSLPVGGASQHAVLTAHRGLSSATLFTELDRVTRGDSFTLEVFGEVLSYQVVETKVVAPQDTESLFPKQGKDLVTLVTCTPLGINSQRILVTGQRIEPTPAADLAAANQDPEIPGFPWWAAGFGVGGSLIGGYLAWSRRRSGVEIPPERESELAC